MILTSEQNSAVQMVQACPVSILTGGPGTGKTTTCREILNWADSAGMRVSCCAPSGKAAKRMEESTGRAASTIHKLLEAEAQPGGGFGFTRGASYPINCDLLVIDETSMVDNSLMAALLRAAPQNSKVLFVGDDSQLPSVQEGAVLRDIVAAETIPHTNLTVIHRNSGDIVKACHGIKRGEMYEPSATLDVEAGLNLRHIECRNPTEIKEIVTQLVCERMPARGFDPLNDVQVLCATNDKTDISCAALNTVLRARLNSAFDPEIKQPFFAGDKIINTKNETTKDSFIINGDMGFITEADEKRMICAFSDPERSIPLHQKMNNLLLAYAITVHRFQGSEAPVVIIPVHRSASFLLTRAWIYTAISRAKKICITVGERAAVQMAIRKDDSNNRITRLKELLQ